MSDPPLLIRCPVWVKLSNEEEQAPVLSLAGTPKTVAYVLGENVVKAPQGQTWSEDVLKNLLQVVGKAIHQKFQLKQNFSETGLRPVSITSLCPFIEGAGIVHILCHGVDFDGGLYLQLATNELGKVRSNDVLAWRLPGQPLVFVNACSSGAASFSSAGLTTFGTSFLRAGAAIYIGTLATVATDSALKFATAFFDACFGDGLSVADAMNRVRESMARSADPTWRLYSIYGDMRFATSPIH